MEYKLLALDMDGTVLSDDSVSVSQANLDAINAAIARGVIVVYCTGRMRNRLPEMLQQGAPGMRYAVTSNGAAVVDFYTGEVLHADGMSPRLASDLAARLGAYPIPIDVYCDGNDYCDRRTAALIQELPFSLSRKRAIMRGRFVVEDLPAFLASTELVVEKFNLLYLADDLRPEILGLLDRTEGICVSSSCPGNAEINAAGVNKGTGLRRLCDYLGVYPDQVMAIGDNGNDREMMEFAGLAVAMENATEDILALADDVTASNMADGVAVAIEKYLL